MAIISGFRSHTDRNRTPLLFSGYQIFLRNLKNANKILLYVFWPLKIILSSILVDFFGQIQPSANITIPQTRECKCHKQLFFACVLDFWLVWLGLVDWMVVQNHKSWRKFIHAIVFLLISTSEFVELSLGHLITRVFS